MSWSDNARKWYNHALKTGDDSIARFMMHWIAFNFEYNRYLVYDEEGKRNSERDQIEHLCRSRYRALKQCPILNDPKAIKKLLEYPVLRGKKRPHGSLEPQLPDREKRPQDMTPEELWGVVCLGNGLRRIQCILLTLYQVRCNLFHGSKDPEYPRDRQLVRESAAIMEACMGTLLNVNQRPNGQMD